VANLLPETSQEELRASLIPYEKIINIETERWSKHYRYAVENGVRRVTIMMNRQVPSHLTVAGCRVLLSYEGQPATCYGCGEVGHVYQGCPARQKLSQARIAPTQQTYANVVSAPTARKEYHPTTVTVDKEQQAAPVHQDATSPPTTDAQRDTDITSNKSGDIEPQPHAMKHVRQRGKTGFDRYCRRNREHGYHGIPGGRQHVRRPDRTGRRGPTTRRHDARDPTQ
jgi:hypothetical protein